MAALHGGPSRWWLAADALALCMLFVGYIIDTALPTLAVLSILAIAAVISAFAEVHRTRRLTSTIGIPPAAFPVVVLFAFATIGVDERRDDPILQFVGLVIAVIAVTLGLIILDVFPYEDASREEKILGGIKAFALIGIGIAWIYVGYFSNSGIVLIVSSFAAAAIAYVLQWAWAKAMPVRSMRSRIVRACYAVILCFFAGVGLDDATQQLCAETKSNDPCVWIGQN